MKYKGGNGGALSQISSKRINPFSTGWKFWCWFQMSLWPDRSSSVEEGSTPFQLCHGVYPIIRYTKVRYGGMDDSMDWVGDNRMFWFGLVRHHLSSRGGISEMLHSCRRPSRQHPLRLRWSLYWRGGGLQPFQCECCIAGWSPISQCSGHGRTLAEKLNSPKRLMFNFIFHISQLALTLASKYPQSVNKA